MYITCERFATMGAEFSTLTLNNTQVINATTDIYNVCNGKCGIVRIYANKPTDKHYSPSSSICFSNGDDLMFCIAVFQKNCFYPYKSNGIGDGFSFIGEENTFPKMADMKATLESGDKTCYWDADKAKLNIPGKCLTFEEIKKLFSEIKRDNTIQPVFTKNEEDFPVIPNSRTSSPTPTLVKEENSDDAVVDAPADAPADAPFIVNGMPMVLPTYTYIPVNGVMSQFNTITNKVMVYIGNDPVWLPLSHKNK